MDKVSIQSRAFPQTWEKPVINDGVPSIHRIVEQGLTKREYFATMAMQGMLANHDNRTTIEHIIEKSIFAADELIKQLENK